MIPQRSLHPGRHLLDGTVRVLLAEALFPLTGIITAAFLTRRLGPDGYGLFTLAVTIVTWIEWNITSAFSRTTIKFVGEAQDWRPVGATVLRLYVGVSSSAALLLWVLAPFIAELLNETVLSIYLKLLSFDILLFSLAQAHQNILVGLGGFRQRALASAGRWLGRLLLIVVLVELGFAVPGAICGLLGASCIELLIYRFHVRPSLASPASFPVRQLWGYAAPLFLSAVSLGIYTNLDLLALKLLGGTAAQAGIFGAARNLALVPSLFALSFAPLLLATLSRMLYMGEDEQARAIGREALRVVTGLLPFVSLSAGVAPEIILWIFGTSFSPAADLLPALMFGAHALVMIAIVTAILTAAGNPKRTVAFTGPLVPLAITGHLLLIPRLGALGAALVSMSVAWIGALVAVFVVYRSWHILPPAGTLWRSIVASVGAYVLAALWPTPDFLLFVKLPAVAFFIVLVFLVLGEFTTAEMTFLRALVGWPTPPLQSQREG